MNGWLEFFDYFIYGAVLLLSVIGLWFTIVIPGTDRFTKRFFLSYFIIFMLCGLSAIVETVFRYHIVPGATFYILLLLETLLLSLPLPMMTIGLLHFCGERVRGSRLLYTALGLWAAFLVLLFSSPFIDGIIYVTPENQYYQGPLYLLLEAPVISILLLNFAGTLLRRAKLSRKAFLSFVIAEVPMTVVVIVNLFIDVIPLFELSYVLSALSMYGLILSDQIEKDLLHQREIARQQSEIAEQQREIAEQQREIAEQQREIAEQQREIAHERASVMVLQMRPHFIYNALTTIHSLCRLDPPKARQITMDFTNYLRNNFNAVASDSTIQFYTELEHTRAYLAVEQAQHDDMLSVDYDTPFTHFRLPPLTLQPIVENAVKHGMNPYSGPLRISVRTRHTDSGTEVIVEDNGPGFDPAEANESGIALKNIRQRLEMMCGGRMTITPREGGGTVVMITIPDSAAE